MKKLNFNGLKSIETPDSWIKNAAAIPDQTDASHRVSPLRSAVIAASFVLVAALSVSAFLIFGNRNTAPVASAPIRETQTAAKSESPTQSGVTQAAESAGAAEHTEAETQQQASAKAETQTSTDAEGGAVITTITTITTIVDDAPAEEEETSDPAPYGDDETQDTPQTEPDGSLTIEAVYSPRSSELHSSSIGASDNPDQHGDLHGYCLIYDEEGGLIGESEYFHPQRFAKITNADDSRLMISYCPAEHNIFLAPGRYRYILLNEQREIITSGWLDIS